MEAKFENVPVEEDTVVLSNQVAKWGEEIDVLYQRWSWDGITGASLIFAEEDIKDVEDEDLLIQVQESPIYDESYGEITLSRNRSGFAFVNFNFES